MPDPDSHASHAGTVTVWLNLTVDELLDETLARRLAARFGMPVAHLHRPLTAESLAADATARVARELEPVVVDGHAVTLRPRVHVVDTASEHNRVEVEVSADLPAGLAGARDPAVTAAAGTLRHAIDGLANPADATGDAYRWLRWRWRSPEGYEWINGRPDRPVSSKASFARHTRHDG